ncbi:MAG: ECF transporter S component [Ruminococcus sp.]|jgi:cytidylate kinase/predicted membrane protein|nr:ECF transporter S component [Ruminococcus sp.]
MRKILIKITLTALFIALGLVLPFLTGQIPSFGSAMLPMHIPALLCGIFVGPWYGLVCGIIMPLLRSSIFGMPPLFPTAVAMAFELGAYGLIIGLMQKVFKKSFIGLYASLIIAMIGGRIVWGIVMAAILGIFGNPMAFNYGDPMTFDYFIKATVITAVPGIILQLVLIPGFVVAVRILLPSEPVGVNEIKELAASQLSLYPKAQSIDILKAIYQNEFGAGHMISDPAVCLKMIEDETAELEKKGDIKTGDYVEHLGNGLARLHLRAILQTGISAQTFAKIFMFTAVRPRGNRENFLRKVKLLEKLCKDKTLKFSEESIVSAVSMWEAGGGGLFRHSDIFRENYHPAYRVVERQFCDYLDVFSKIDSIKKENPERSAVIVIDGRCGAGKTTLAAMLSLCYDCEIIPMDSFFPQEKTDGINIDITRFKSDVLEKIRLGKPFEYQPYSCSTGQFESPVSVNPGKLIIIEGSYSLYPGFVEYYDLKIFMTVKSDEQLKRIRLRDPESAEAFKKRWIPLEEEYFREYAIEDSADLKYSGNKIVN